MPGKRRLSCSEPEEKTAKRSKLRSTLDPDDYHWELLDAVRPVFSSDLFVTYPTWASPNVWENDDVTRFKIRTLIRGFTIEMNPQMCLGPPQCLREQQRKSYRQCLEDVLKILNTFVSEDILEDSMFLPLVDDEDDQEQNVQATTAGHNEPSRMEPEDKSPLSKVLKWIKACGWDTTGYFSNQALNKAEATPSIQSPAESYPKLERLARLAKRLNKDSNQERVCFDYVKTEHAVQDFMNLEGKTRVLNLCLESIKKKGSAGLEPDQKPRIPPTQWQNYDACTASGSLYRTLSDKLKDCMHDGQQHQVKLQLNGFELDHWVSSSAFSVLFQWFTLETRKKWAQHQCAPLKRYPEPETNLTFMDDICDSLRVSRKSLRIHFFDNNLYSIPERKLPSHGNDVSIVTLSTLLDQGYLQSIMLNGAFTYEDKAVLTLSLGRCLLHLFGTPWIHQWSASDVHFLRKTNAGSGCEEILNIHHPYLMCPLTRVEVEHFDLAHSHLVLLSFAKLLLEIETGDRIKTKFDIGTEEFVQELYPILERVQSKHEDYAAAIHGCLSFKIQVREYGYACRRTREGKLASARKCLYEHIIKKLEINFDRIPHPEQSLEPRNLHLEKRQTNLGFFSVEKPDYVERMILPRDNFFSDAQFTSRADHITSAQSYFELFDIFREQHILSTLKSVKSSRPKVKVAILDTGICKDDPSIRGLLNKRADTESQGLLKKPRDPIRFVKNCLRNGHEDATDTCGHGTHMAYLLMRVAPEADLYIYKISEGMKDNNAEDIKTAIDDAVDQNVDIISMSFGFKEIPSKVESAIGNAYNRGIRETALFAAASNNGLNTSRTFPARDNRVVGVHALDGLGKDSSSINPAKEDWHDNLGTLGLGIRLHWNNRWDYKSGTSYATAIAAGIAVNILTWLGSAHDQGILETKDFDQLRRPHIIRKIMQKHLVRGPNNSGDVVFVAPWHLWKPLDTGRPREKMARDIVGKLQADLRDDFCSPK